MAKHMRTSPAGLWPSEGSVSDEALHLAAETGFKWFATDNGVLGRTLNANPDPHTTYRPYLWRQGDHQLHGLFRDHYLSDLIGFVYSRMGAADAARHFMDRIHENCAPILRSGADALVPIILDGENAWEYYEESGRPFLRELYRLITDDHRMTRRDRVGRAGARRGSGDRTYLSGVVDQCELRCVDRRRGRQQGLGVPAARAAGVRPCGARQHLRREAPARLRRVAHR